MTWFLATALAAPIPEQSTQLVLAVVPHADDSHASVTRWSRTEEGWRQDGAAVAARIGAKGVAWGRGLHPEQPGLQKVEGDNRAPAGVFTIGDAYGDAPSLASSVAWPYHPVGPRDLWVEDPTSPYYNQHLRVEGDRPLLPWEAKAVMKLGDPAHALKVFIGHNAPPDAVPGKGSAIFLHVWRREGAAATAGCTAMARKDLDSLVDWLDPAGRPVFVLLTQSDLARLAEGWELPAP